MHPEPHRAQWPDSEGELVGVGDWIEVWCSWTDEPKFEGRAVQIADALSGHGQTVFQLYDPTLQTRHYMPAHLGSFRKVVRSRQSGIFRREDLEEKPAASSAARIRRYRCVR